MEKRKRGRPKNAPNPNGRIVADAIERAGGRSRVAFVLGLGRPTVYWWAEHGHVPQTKHAVAFSRLTGVPVEKLTAPLADDLADMIDTARELNQQIETKRAVSA